jgi:DNA polymerase (family 10)
MKKNLEIARLFYEIADILEMRGVDWKPRAYRTAAKALETMSADIEEVYKKGELFELPGVGEGIGNKIIEFLKTGNIKEHEKLMKTVPKHFIALMNVPFIGPKKAKRLFSELKISSVKQLEDAAKKHKIAKISGFGEKSEKDILEGIAMIKVTERKPIAKMLPIANKLVSQLKNLKEVENISVAGSLRRKRPTIRDIDIVASSKSPDKVIEAFTKLPDVQKITAKGQTKATIFLKSEVQADIRVFPPEQWGSGLLYLTGSKSFNIYMRRVAIKFGYKLNEYGLFKGSKRIAGKTEEEVFKKLGLKYVSPEKREI